MITLEECTKFAALEANELFTGTDLSGKHQALLSSYCFNLKRGPVTVRKMIVSDIRAAIDLGASKFAADLVLVLRLFLAKYPEGKIVRRISGKKGPWFATCRLDPNYRETCICGR